MNPRYPIYALQMLIGVALATYSQMDGQMLMGAAWMFVAVLGGWSLWSIDNADAIEV